VAVKTTMLGCRIASLCALAIFARGAWPQRTNIHVTKVTSPVELTHIVELVYEPLNETWELEL